MSVVEVALLLMAILAILGVIFEEVTHISKSIVVLFFGTLAWMLLFISAPDEAFRLRVQEAFNHNILDIAGLWLFLMATMTFVAYLNKKGLIDSVIFKILPRQISERKLLFLTALFCFAFSSFADNITATLVSMALVLSLKLELRKALRFATLVVFSVNSGGVAMITGDVTTLMIFLAGKVEITQLLLLSLPALAAVMLLAGMLSIGMNGVVTIDRSNRVHSQRTGRMVAWVFFLTIFATILLSLLFDIPPTLTFLAGLSVMFLLAHQMEEKVINDPILEYIRAIEFETLLFFLGILLVVGMLQFIGVLGSLTALYDMMPTLLANFLMGLLSALIDNVPLTAALLKSDLEMSVAEWMGLTYAVGVGGSLLIIGSAAGIVAMSKLPGLTFMSYFRSFGLLFFAFVVGFLAVYGVGVLITP
ncbi:MULTISPECIES: sodium:proton antiporter NhaD [Halopseudomonas]|uniref:Na+/H+ antiporter NhaD n=1 Tax=Halopseudomonas bauzanensis TaxID=653930 RepID=A0A1H9WL29_9GAMM|nr:MULTISPECIES: sodium:proton antiporter NhaD [Halopseudomonas]TKA89831.1 sodium:proton antiporter [Halopseudomonas bauzanensis]WGK61993.1 sodium:proton antiporter NhaD [Halopseudomonas sp. SMJS2]SES34610.1 sodium/proton antiporter, NhaD family [Halopseudomonas bauzanensis]SFM36497.1 Na+/H+ antiporter NhaD [Halopseudomonas bauzanensis]